MTRINVGVKPSELCRQHLIAEHREIKRIPNAVRSGRAVIKDIPDTFRLGTGHVKFFYDKLGYLLRRYETLYAECVKRGYNVTSYHECWNEIPNELMGNYTPTEQDRLIVLERIEQRLNGE